MCFVPSLWQSLLFHQETLNGRKIIGSIIGFAGVVLVNLTGGGVDLGFRFWEGFIFLSAVAYTFSSACMKIFQRTRISCLKWLAVSDRRSYYDALRLCGGRKTDRMDGKGVLLLLYMAMISAVAYSLWSILLKYNPVSKVAVFGFMNPVCGVILSAVLLGDRQLKCDVGGGAGAGMYGNLYCKPTGKTE